MAGTNKSAKAVICVGLACLDMVQTVSSYPQEDSDQRSNSARWQRGGNACNNCTVLADIGVSCEFLGTLGQDLTLQFILEDLARLRIAAERCPRVAGASCPISNVIISEASGSRTIVHHPGTVPELSASQLMDIDWTQFSWVHFEGRNCSTVGATLRRLQSLEHRPVTSVELEKPRRELDELLPLADLVLMGRDYAESRGWLSGEAAVLAAASEAKQGAIVVCAWGSEGAWALQQGSTDAPLHSPAFPPPRVVDTLGAGDTFVAGLIAARLLWPRAGLQRALEVACRLAGAKVGQEGLTGLGSVWRSVTDTMDPASTG